MPSGVKRCWRYRIRDPQQLAASDLEASRWGLAYLPPAGGMLYNRWRGVTVVCDNLGGARVLASELDALSQTRKEIEQGMQAEARLSCAA